MSERPVFIVEDFLLVSQTKATVTLCGPLSVVQKLCPIGALVELREAPSDHPTVDPLSNICVDLVRRRVIVPLPISLSERWRKAAREAGASTIRLEGEIGWAESTAVTEIVPTGERWSVEVGT